MSDQTFILKALAADLHAQGHGAWSDAGVAEPGLPAIILDETPEEPAEIITLACYAEDEVATYRRDVESVNWYVQIRLRFDDPDAGRDLQDALRDRYHRRRTTVTGPGGESIALRGFQVSRSPLGSDQNGRRLYTQNFRFTGLRARPE